MKRSRAADFFDTREEEEGEDIGSSDEEEESKVQKVMESDEEGDEDEEEEEEEEEEERPQKKVKLLSDQEIADKQKQLRKTGVVYISRVPPFMKPEKMRHILQRFGGVDRIFLAPEDPTVRSRRVKYGGNKKKSYTEGWAEFKKKKDAKLAAETLNGNQIGGKKNSFYYDDILNVKYLHKFKWSDLTDQITREAQARKDKLRAEISQATSENKAFIQNVEQAKMIEGIQQKRGQKDDTVRRTFNQRKTETKRTDESKPVRPSGKSSNVLSKVF